MSDPILEAKTVAELMAKLAERYHLDLPKSFPAGTPLETLWEEGITVSLLPTKEILYKAMGTSFARIPMPQREGRVTVEVMVPPPKEE